MKAFKDENWGLKILALVLAIVIYHWLKNSSVHNEPEHDRHILQQH